MKKHLIEIAFIVVALSILCGCEKYDSNALFTKIKLVNEIGIQKSQFKVSDSIIFEFYLTNQTGNDAIYLSPCHEYGNYLRIYRENSEGIYEYFGRPVYPCATVAFFLSISDGETIMLNRIPWIAEHGWPEIETGKYYVGDTLTLDINDSKYDFIERIYFEIFQ